MVTAGSDTMAVGSQSPRPWPSTTISRAMHRPAIGGGDADAVGIDISDYAIANAMPEVKDRLSVGNAVSLPYPDKSFDLVVSLNTLHNLRIYDLEKALKEIERVGKKHKYIVMDSYRDEREKVNLLYWQLTCECIFTPQEWEWVFAQCGYTGDYGCIFFD